MQIVLRSNLVSHTFLMTYPRKNCNSSFNNVSFRFRPFSIANHWTNIFLFSFYSEFNLIFINPTNIVDRPNIIVNILISQVKQFNFHKDSNPDSQLSTLVYYHYDIPIQVLKLLKIFLLRLFHSGTSIWMS